MCKFADYIPPGGSWWEAQPDVDRQEGAVQLWQLGREGGQTRFEAVGGLAQHTVTGAVCGANHSPGCGSVGQCV